VAVLSAVTIAAGLISLRYRTLQERNYAERRIGLNMMPQLAAGSDRLTNSSRNFAATGDRRFREEFMRELYVDRTRDLAVVELQRIQLTPQELSLLKRAKAASDLLVGLETRAVEAVDQQDRPAALALVFGEEFRNSKASVVQAIADCRQSVDARLTDQALELAQRARVAGYVGLGAIILNAGGIVAALLMFYRRRVVNPIASLNQNLRDLLAHTPGVSIGHTCISLTRAAGFIAARRSKVARRSSTRAR